jgi:hypothetical protein
VRHQSRADNSRLHDSRAEPCLTAAGMPLLAFTSFRLTLVMCPSRTEYRPQDRAGGRSAPSKVPSTPLRSAALRCAPLGMTEKSAFIQSCISEERANSGVLALANFVILVPSGNRSAWPKTDPRTTPKSASEILSRVEFSR